MLNEILLNPFFTFCSINQMKWSCGFQPTQILIGIKNPIERFRELKMIFTANTTSIYLVVRFYFKTFVINLAKGLVQVS